MMNYLTAKGGWSISLLLDQHQFQHLFDDETEDTKAQNEKNDECAIATGLGILRQFPHDEAHVANQEAKPDREGNLLKLLLIHLGCQFYMVF